MENLFDQKIFNANYLFDDYYLSARSLYAQMYKGLPSVSYIGQVDGEKSLDVLKEKLGDRITGIFQYQCYHQKKKAFRFNTTLLVLDSQCVVELEASYCEIFHNGQQRQLIEEITAIVSPLRVRNRREPLEINIVVQERNKLTLKPMEIKRTKLDLDLFYGEQFGGIDALIRKRLNKKKDKGIVLLHGLPGTGKTTYLRYLIGKIKKRVLFLSPLLAGNLMNPDFVELLINNPETVVIIEDAENVIMDRKYNAASAVSNLLNISDGLLADFLNVQLICTFNSTLTLIDSALVRKGRLIAKHEFGKLTLAESQRLSRHFGFDTVIKKPMTLAEIANQHEKSTATGQPDAIGFRRQTIEN
jgi:ATPase family protein associated with various cellular activities (AAA)